MSMGTSKPRDYRAVAEDRLQAAAQQYERLQSLEKIAKAEAELWRKQCDISERERVRYKRAFFLVFAFDVLAFVASAVWAVAGR